MTLSREEKIILFKNIVTVGKAVKALSEIQRILNEYAATPECKQIDDIICQIEDLQMDICAEYIEDLDIPDEVRDGVIIKMAPKKEGGGGNMSFTIKTTLTLKKGLLNSRRRRSGYAR